MMRAFASGLLGGITAVVLLVGLMGQTIIGGGGGVAVPTAGIILDDSGGCPTGYTEVTAARGRYLVGVPSGGTVAGTLGTAMADVADASYTPAGTNGTAAFTPAGTLDSVSAGTPTGTVSQPTFTGDALAGHGHTFTGSALAGHAHTETIQEVTASNLVYLNENVYGQGSAVARNRQIATTAGSGASDNFQLTESVSGGIPAGTLDSVTGGSPTGTVSQPTFTGSALAGHIHTFSGAGGTVPAQTFTGTATTTMRSTVAPTLQLTLCKRS